MSGFKSEFQCGITCPITARWNRPTPLLPSLKYPWKRAIQVLLSEAQFTIMNFIKGPVSWPGGFECYSGSLLGIFLSPNPTGACVSGFSGAQQRTFIFAVMDSNNLIPVSNWATYSRLQMNYLETKAAYVRDNIKSERV